MRLPPFVPLVATMSCMPPMLGKGVAAPIPETEPSCPIVAAKMLPEGDALKRECDETQRIAVLTARDFLESHNSEIADALSVVCQGPISFKCPTESYETLREWGAQADHYCPTEDIRSQDLSGAVLASYGGWAFELRSEGDAGAYALPKETFAADFCSFVGIVAHEEAHVATAMVHSIEDCLVNRDDWVGAVGRIAEQLCTKEHPNSTGVITSVHAN